MMDYRRHRARTEREQRKRDVYEHIGKTMDFAAKAGRNYSVQDIERLRSAVYRKMTFGRYDGGKPYIGMCPPEPEPVRVEEAIRTHMMAGHTSRDLLASEGKEP